MFSPNVARLRLMASQSIKIWLVIRVRSPGSTKRCEKTDMENLLSALGGETHSA